MKPLTNDFEGGDNSSVEHDRIPNAVYWGMDWYCTGYHKVLGERIRENWGQITAEIAIRDIISATNTGDLHVTVYDYNRDDMYVSFARQRKYDEFQDSTYIDAWRRSYTRLHVADLFGELLDGCGCSCSNGEADLETCSEWCLREYLEFEACSSCQEGFVLENGSCVVDEDENDDDENDDDENDDDENDDGNSSNEERRRRKLFKRD